MILTLNILPMLNSTQHNYLLQLTNYLPERRKGKRGPNTISKSIIIPELYKLFKTNCGWRNINHPTVCRNYLDEIQRRGLLQKFLKNITKDILKHRPPIMIIDTSDIVSYRTKPSILFSGKYHNYCQKLSLIVTDCCVPVYGDLHKGSEPDSTIFDTVLTRLDKLAYEFFGDKGFEKYERRRDLAKRNCPVRIEMKKYKKNKKLGRRFSFTEKQRAIRGGIEKVMAWIKSFGACILNRLRTKSLFKAMFLFCLSYVAFMRVEKL